MTWVKVCGITSEVARDAAIHAGADALGYVCIEGSPRYLDVERVAELTRVVSIPSYVLVAEAQPAAALAIADACGATGIQPYGDSVDAVAAEALDAGYAVLRPIGVDSRGPMTEPDVIPAGATVLFDTAAPGVLGGSGRTFAWESVAGITRRFVLAGGLGPDNVATAIRIARPFGVDASSRLESSPGFKDPDTIRAFVEEAKRA